MYSHYTVLSENLELVSLRRLLFVLLIVEIAIDFFRLGTQMVVFYNVPPAYFWQNKIAFEIKLQSFDGPSTLTQLCMLYGRRCNLIGSCIRI